MTPCVGPHPTLPLSGRGGTLDSIARRSRQNARDSCGPTRRPPSALPATPALSTIFIVDSTIKVVDGDGMARKASSKPTQTEIEILGILWERWPSTLREVHERLGAERSIGYTGVLKLLQNMFAKGLVRRDQDERAHVYEACEP